MTQKLKQKREWLVGERCLVKVRPIETTCQNCGWHYGTESNGLEYVGIIVPRRGFRNCAHCGYIETEGEGWYAVEVNGKRFAVPYTLLYELEESDD